MEVAQGEITRSALEVRKSKLNAANFHSYLIPLGQSDF